MNQRSIRSRSRDQVESQKLRLPASVITTDDFFGGVQRVPVASRLNRLNITSNQLEGD